MADSDRDTMCACESGKAFRECHGKDDDLAQVRSEFAYTGTWNHKRFDEFEALMLAIDEDLRESDVSIFQRPMAAAIEFQRRTRIVEPIAGRIPGSPESHTERVYRWYDAQYGDRQKVDMSPGATMLVIRDEPWRCDLPRIWGTVSFDIRALIRDLPPNLAASLTMEEMRALTATFRSRLDLFHRMERSGLKYLPEARKDLSSGVCDVCKAPPNLPMAKHSFSQAAEKALKGFSLSKGKKPERRHEFLKMAELAEGVGLPPVPRRLLDMVKCPGGARYGELKVSQKEAILAHDAALTIVAHVLAATSI